MQAWRVFSLSAIFVITCVSAGCAGGPIPVNFTGTATPAVSPTVALGATPTEPPASVTPVAFSSPAELKYQLLAQFSPIFFCDPDSYPVAHQVSAQEIAQRVAALQKNADVYGAILKHLGLAGTPTLTPEQNRLVYEESKKLNAIDLKPAGDKFTFSLRTSVSQKQGLAISGLIDRAGNITIDKQQSTVLTCPICLAANTRIDTPAGQVRVQDLRPGMPIWTIDASGARHAGIVLETTRRAVPVDFRIVHLTLDDGRTLDASPNHPTVDGRTIGELVPGDMLDHARAVNVEQVPYTGQTYDILPSGETGAYWANGILLKSTLMR